MVLSPEAAYFGAYIVWPLICENSHIFLSLSLSLSLSGKLPGQGCVLRLRMLFASKPRFRTYPKDSMMLKIGATYHILL